MIQKIPNCRKYCWKSVNARNKEAMIKSCQHKQTNKIDQNIMWMFLSTNHYLIRIIVCSVWFIAFVKCCILTSIFCLKIVTRMVPDVEDFFRFRFKTSFLTSSRDTDGNCLVLFRKSFICFPYTNMIFIIFC